jgi:hypothetical protein
VPMTTAEVVAAVQEAGGHGDGARPGLTPRVRGSLAYLKNQGRLKKLGKGRSARWTASPGAIVRRLYT